MKFMQYIDVWSKKFINLIDTPSSYTDQGGKFVKVKVDDSGLEFVDESTGGGGASPPTTITSTTTNDDNGTNHTHALDDLHPSNKSASFATVTIDKKGRVTALSPGSVSSDWSGQLGSSSAGSTYAVLISGDANLPTAQYFVSYFFMINIMDIATGVSDYVTGTIVGEKTTGTLLWTVKKVGAFSLNVDIQVVNVSGNNKLRLVPASGSNFGFNSRFHFWRSRELVHWA